MKKLLSLILSGAIFVSCMPVLAVADDAQATIFELPWEEEEIESSGVATPIPILSPQVQDEAVSEEALEEAELPEYEPIVHEEIIGDDIEFPPEGKIDLMPGELPEPGTPATLSLNSNDQALWKSLYIEQFGEDYLNTFGGQNTGQTVFGDTNRLMIEETDLTLPGKNGLDVVIKRKYDNQGYNDSYSSYRGSSMAPTNQVRYIYGFKNKTTNETVYIGFLTEDQMYSYMYNGCYIKPLDEDKLQTDEKGTIRYYNFESIASSITDDTSYDKLEYDSSIDMIIETVKYDSGSINVVESRRLFEAHKNEIGAGWSLVIPDVSLYAYEHLTDKSDTKTTYTREYVGALKDINGDVYTLTGNDEFVKRKNGDNTYTSTFSADKNKYLHFESLYNPAKLYENGPEYNFVVYDGTGLTYYLYNEGIKANSVPSIRHKMSIVAVEDEYGNMIRYEYDNSQSSIKSVSKIIDTYGREINISNISGGKQISYYDDIDDEMKNITYTMETLPASELANDSPIAPKSVSRFTVTNAEGESTIYDERMTATTCFYSMPNKSSTIDDLLRPGREQVNVLSGYNIERIIYPTGAETRYRYKCIYPISPTTNMRRGVYAVDDSYDIIDGKETNHKTYSLGTYFVNNDQKAIKVTCTDNGAGKVTESKYDAFGLLNTAKTSSGNLNKDVSYYYDSYDNPTKIVTNEDGTVITNTYVYASGYPNVLQKQSDGLKTINYSYHMKNGRATDKIKQITYSMNGENKVTEDYYISTELTPDGNSIQYERTIKDDVIKSQKKYEYDNEGNVTAVKQWTSDTNADGVLDENDDVITLSNTYTITPKKTKNVTNTFANIVNADGVNEGDVTEEYKYNIYGAPLSQKDPYGMETTIEYDDMNRPVKYNLPNGGIRTIEYHTADHYILLTDEAGIVTKQEYDDMGRPKAVYRNDGVRFNKIQEYKYDGAGRTSEKISYTSNTEGTKETYTYDALDRIKSKSVYSLPNQLLYKESYSYSNSRTESVVTTTTTASGASAAQQKNYYNQYGQLTKAESISGDTTLTTLYENDYLGRVTKQTDPNGNVTTYEYDQDGRVVKQTNAKGDSVTTVYDLAGQVVSVTDANGNTTNTEYDKLGRVVKETTPFNDTASGETKTYYDKNSNVVKTMVKRSAEAYQTEEYKYDIMGNMLASITNDGTTDLVTQYEYDTAGRVTEMITGLSEYNDTPAGGAVTQYSYNDMGYLSQVIDPMGLTQTYGYDYAGNVTSTKDKNGNTMRSRYGAFGVEKTYFTGSPDTKEYVYDNLGRVKTAISVNSDGRSVEENYSYDDFGRLTKVISNDGSEQNYIYDANSNVTEYTLVQDGVIKNTVGYEYDSLNQLTKLENNDIITSYEYDANGNAVKKEQDNGISTSYTYNKAGMMTYTETAKGSEVYTSSEVTYLLNGLVTNITMPYDGDAPWERKSKNYKYDAAGRLTNEYIVHGAGQPVQDSYEYDLRGNRVKKIEGRPDDQTETTINYQYDLNNKLLSSDTTLYDEYNDTNEWYSDRYYYDNNGNMTARQRTQIKSQPQKQQLSSMDLSGHGSDSGLEIYRYDAFNRLTNYNSGRHAASYTYNANNLRASKTVNNTKTDFVWNGQNLAAESTDSGVNTYTYDITGIHTTDQNGTVMSYIKDSHGSVIRTADAAGNAMQEAEDRADYDAFGNVYTGSRNTPFGYSGEYVDSESGNIYLRNRYYNSATGRFITEDPAQDGLNWYVYAGNNPVSFVDPWGLYRLEFDNDGRVYAVIDLSAGDTLYNIAQAEVGDGNAWVNMGYQYDPGYLFDGEWVDITGIYNDAYPNPNPNKPYIGPEDYAAGVRLAYTNGNFYYDVSIPVNNALDRDRGLFEQNGNDLSWFSTMVGDNGVWNLKYYDSVTGYSSWENTIGVTFPGYGPLMLFGEIVNIEDIGNITYGYLGGAAGLSFLLYIGSSANHFSNHSWSEWNNEWHDQSMIKKGYNWYQSTLEPVPGPAPQ